ncbi:MULTISPECIES: ABC transporter permease [unclassified Streptomyces]|jgi:osmoprotectant transport system permease protein|uniref:ABC transporter permease n=1 Tax=unclassified Streptomyces TaxID=2593676 RepID=UPI00081B91A8|nr:MULTISPECIES: ABC transporter permease [unclassified Streptomyces]MEE1745088.1 ABC transporter permease [Streptomyces sp. JV184]MYQ87433.1 ABC transporter permease subunit [Streptomyces sp. SID4936]SCE47041.1 osmoprotectant transport system permease protein [Streptomyces sp. DvalAA-43]
MGVLGEAWTWLTTGANWSGESGAAHRLGEHLYVSGVALALACAIALPVALFLGHIGKGGALAVNLSNVGRAIPVFAVLALFMVSPLRNAGYVPTVIALVLFAVPPLLTNAYVGMTEVDRSVTEAARGMGMSGRQLFLRVELPLAYPMIMTGLRSAAVQVVATATIAAMVGQGGLGRIITAGFNTYNTPQVVAGAVLVAVLALLVEAVLVGLDRLLSPLRRRRAAPGGANATAA